MAFIAPIAGALGGGLLFGQIGAAVGWLVGSWLFNDNEQQQNQIFDPGAEEMPRFNTAVRGATMPHLFGTNRVAPQIVWQHDFTTIRHENTEGGDGGGKFGGSGMKGAAGGSGTTVSYQYKWDLLYHLGMVPEQYSLYGGWLGPDRLSADTILSVTNNAAGGLQWFFGFADQNSIEQKASLVFEESFFYQGLGAGNDQGQQIPGWAEITSDMGLELRWPHTVWIGFKQMDLGGFPHVPQLSFEIGPGNPEITFDSAYVGSAAESGIVPSPHPSGMMITGDDGKKYVIITGNGTEAGRIYQYDSVANTYTLVDTVTAAEIDSDATALGLDPGSAYDFSESTVWLAAIPGHNYFIGHGRDLGTATRSNHAIVLYKIDSTGTREALGGYQARSNVLNTDPQCYCVGVAGGGANSDVILMYGEAQVSATFYPLLVGIPPISAMDGAIIIVDDGTNAWDDNVVDLTSLMGGSRAPGGHSSYRNYEGWGWFTPVAAIDATALLTGMPSWTTRFYQYIGKSDMSWATDNPGSGSGSDYVESLAGTYPNGAVSYLDIPAITFSGSTITMPSISGPTIDNDNFTGLFDDVAKVPFDDSGENIDGTADLNDDYHPSPTAQKLTRGQAQGATLVMFAKVFTGSEDMDPTGDWARVRGFIYNPLSTKHLEFGGVSGSPWDTVADIGASGANRYNHTTYVRRAVFDEELSKLFIWDNKTSADSNLAQTHFGEFGEFQINGGADVLPPYIIYQILTNGWFGLGKVAADIDQASYEAALLYCDANDFRVSAQYRRDENALNIIEELLSVYGGFLIISDGLIKFKQLEFNDGGSGTGRTIDNDHFIVDRPGEPPIQITKGAKQDTFNKVRVNYFDRNIDYQHNQVEETDEVDQDLFGVRMREFPARFVMAEKTARTMAWRSLWGNLYARDTYSFKLGFKDSDLEPGDVITLVDSHEPTLQSGQICRIVQWKEETRGKFAVTAKQEFDYILSGSSAPLNITSASANDLVGKVPNPLASTMYELPCEFQINDQPMAYVGWMPDNFAAGAWLWVSPDGVTFARAMKVEPYALAGRLISGLPNQSAGTFNENIEVVLFPKSDYYSTSCVWFNATLNEAGAPVRALGGSLLWIGSEMVAYENVTLVSQNRYRFDKVYRGWGGTHIHDHSSGDFWHKHGGGVFKQQFNEDKIGTVIQYKVQPYNLAGVSIDIDSIDAQTYTLVGAHFLPQVGPTPQLVVGSTAYRGLTKHKVTSTAPNGVPFALDWRESARKSGYGQGGFGIGTYGRFTTDPISQSWRVEVYGSGDLVVHSVEVNTATFFYPTDSNELDNGAWRGTLGFNVTPINQYGDAPRTEVVSLELWIS